MRGITRYIGIEATSKGFCFAVLEDTQRLIDWGGRELRGAIATGTFIHKLSRVIDRYRPDVLVIEDPAESFKGSKVKDWLAWAEEFAKEERKIKCVAVSQEEFRAYTSSYGSSKREMAMRLARLFPELEDLVPPKRKAWEHEKRSMRIFVALERALLVAQRDSRGRQDKAPGK